MRAKIGKRSSVRIRGDVCWNERRNGDSGKGPRMTRIIADLPRRVAATVVDVVLLFLALGVVFFLVFAFGGARTLAAALPLLVITGLLWAVVTAAMQGQGSSFGMRAFGLRVDDEVTGEPIGIARGLLRTGVWLALCSVVVGYITVFFDQSGRRRGWHDIVAGAVVTGRPERPKVMVDLPARDGRAGEWLAAMSVPAQADDAYLDPQHTAPDTAVVRVAPSTPAATVVWDDGTMTSVLTRTIFGRNPRPVPTLTVVSVADTTMSLSKTHFEITPTDSGGVVIVDLHSTNGVSLRRDGVTSVLIPGEPLVLRSGDIVEIGPRRARVEVSA